MLRPTPTTREQPSTRHVLRKQHGRIAASRHGQTHSISSAPNCWRGKPNSARYCHARKARHSPKGWRRWLAPDKFSNSSPEKCSARVGKNCRPFVHSSTSKSHASRSASSASSRPGISRSPFQRGKSRPRSPTATAWYSSPPISYPHRHGHWPRSFRAAGFPQACLTW